MASNPPTPGNQHSPSSPYTPTTPTTVLSSSTLRSIPSASRIQQKHNIKTLYLQDSLSGSNIVSTPAAAPPPPNKTPQSRQSTIRQRTVDSPDPLSPYYVQNSQYAHTEYDGADNQNVPDLMDTRQHPQNHQTQQINQNLLKNQSHQKQHQQQSSGNFQNYSRTGYVNQNPNSGRPAFEQSSHGKVGQVSNDQSQSVQQHYDQRHNQQHYEQSRQQQQQQQQPQQPQQQQQQYFEQNRNAQPLQDKPPPPRQYSLQQFDQHQGRAVQPQYNNNSTLKPPQYEQSRPGTSHSQYERPLTAQSHYESQMSRPVTSQSNYENRPPTSQSQHDRPSTTQSNYENHQRQPQSDWSVRNVEKQDDWSKNSQSRISRLPQTTAPPPNQYSQHQFVQYQQQQPFQHPHEKQNDDTESVISYTSITAPLGVSEGRSLFFSNQSPKNENLLLTSQYRPLFANPPPQQQQPQNPHRPSTPQQRTQSPAPLKPKPRTDSLIPIAPGSAQPSPVQPKPPTQVDEPNVVTERFRSDSLNEDGRNRSNSFLEPYRSHSRTSMLPSPQIPRRTESMVTDTIGARERTASMEQQFQMQQYNQMQQQQQQQLQQQQYKQEVKKKTSRNALSILKPRSSTEFKVPGEPTVAPGPRTLSLRQKLFNWSGMVTDKPRKDQEYELQQSIIESYGGVIKSKSQDSLKEDNTPHTIISRADKFDYLKTTENEFEDEDEYVDVMPPKLATVSDTNCSLCGNVFERPVRVTCCGFVGCSQCVLRWVAHSRSCPFCRTRVGTIAIGVKSKGAGLVYATDVQDRVDKLDATCAKCGWTGSRKQYFEEHRNCDGIREERRRKIVLPSHNKYPSRVLFRKSSISTKSSRSSVHSISSLSKDTSSIGKRWSLESGVKSEDGSSLSSLNSLPFTVHQRLNTSRVLARNGVPPISRFRMSRNFEIPDELNSTVRSPLPGIPAEAPTPPSMKPSASTKSLPPRIGGRTKSSPISSKQPPPPAPGDVVTPQRQYQQTKQNGSLGRKSSFGSGFMSSNQNQDSVYRMKNDSNVSINTMSRKASNVIDNWHFSIPRRSTSLGRRTSIGLQSSLPPSLGKNSTSLPRKLGGEDEYIPPVPMVPDAYQPAKNDNSLDRFFSRRQSKAEFEDDENNKSLGRGRILEKGLAVISGWRKPDKRDRSRSADREKSLERNSNRQSSGHIRSATMGGAVQGGSGGGVMYLPKELYTAGPVTGRVRNASAQGYYSAMSPPQSSPTSPKDYYYSQVSPATSRNPASFTPSLRPPPRTSSPRHNVPEDSLNSPSGKGRLERQTSMLSLDPVNGEEDKTPVIDVNEPIKLQELDALPSLTDMMPEFKELFAIEK